MVCAKFQDNPTPKAWMFSSHFGGYQTLSCLKGCKNNTTCKVIAFWIHVGKQLTCLNLRWRRTLTAMDWLSNNGPLVTNVKDSSSQHGNFLFSSHYFVSFCSPFVSLCSRNFVSLCSRFVSLFAHVVSPCSCFVCLCSCFVSHCHPFVLALCLFVVVSPLYSYFVSLQSICVYLCLYVVCLYCFVVALWLFVLYGLFVYLYCYFVSPCSCFVSLCSQFLFLCCHLLSLCVFGLICVFAAHVCGMSTQNTACSVIHSCPHQTETWTFWVKSLFSSSLADLAFQLTYLSRDFGNKVNCVSL